MLIIIYRKTWRGIAPRKTLNLFSNLVLEPTYPPPPLLPPPPPPALLAAAAMSKSPAADQSSSSAAAMTASSALALTVSAPVIAPPSALAPAPVLPPIVVSLDRSNFMLWRALALPNFAGVRLHGFLDGSAKAPEPTVTIGIGDTARTITNPEYEQWWTLDQKVLGHLLGSMSVEISAQLIGCRTAAAAWAAVHTMFAAENSAGVRNLRRQIQALRKGDRPASEYMQKVKALADSMAAAGSPLRDDEIIDYMLTGLGSAFNPIAASMNFAGVPITFPAFYSSVLHYEALQQQQSELEDWQSSANAASRPVYNTTSGRAAESGRQSGGRPSAGSLPPSSGGYGNNQGIASGHNNNGGNGRNGGGNEGGNGGGRNRRWRPRCQICKNWGHEAGDCRSRYDHDHRAANSASTSSSHEPPHWILDTGATDHLTNDLDRLHFHERYGGKDQVQVANGAGLSISHIGHSTIPGSSLRLRNILRLPHIHQHLLFVYRLVLDNDVFVEFHRFFFLVKDIATKKILLRGSTRGGLYPIPFGRRRLPPLAKRLSVSRPPRPSGISVSVIPRIILFKTLLGIMI